MQSSFAVAGACMDNFFNLQYSALVVYVRFIMFFVFARSFSLLSYPFVFEKLPDVCFVAFFIALLHPLLLVLCFDLRSFVRHRQFLVVTVIIDDVPNM